MSSMTKEEWVKLGVLLEKQGTEMGRKTDSIGLVAVGTTLLCLAKVCMKMTGEADADVEAKVKYLLGK